MIKYAATRLLLRKLDRLYNEADGADATLPIAYSKLATLEVCGWLEEAFDEIAHNSVRHKLRTFEKRKLLAEKIEKTHGFDYGSHARPLIAHAVGVVKLMEVERKLESSAALSRLKGNIGSLKILRRDAAHTSLAGRSTAYPAPSISMATFEDCLPVLQQFWKLVRS